MRLEVVDLVDHTGGCIVFVKVKTYACPIYHHFETEIL